VGGDRGQSADIEDVLARAIAGAVAAGRWDVVVQLAKELEARRLERTAAVGVAADELGSKWPTS